MDLTKKDPASGIDQVAFFRQYWRTAATAVGVTALYVLAAFVGLKLAVVHGNVTAIWPPSGIALVALLMFGPRFWPAVAAGAFIVNYSTGVPLATGIGIATGNTLAALAGLMLVHRFSGAAGPLDSVRSLLALFGGGALLAALVSATAGTTALILTGVAAVSELPSIWMTWWLGDAAGVIVFAPLLLAWMRSDSFCRRPLRAVEVLLLTASLVIMVQLVFGGWFFTGSQNYPLAFLLLPVLLWAGFRFGRRGATAAVALMSLLAIWGTVLGYGPFVDANLNKSLLLLQVFMCVNAFTTLMLVVVLKERDAVREGLQQARNQLEQSVEERTRALLEANRFLLDEIKEHRKLSEQMTRNTGSVQVSSARTGAEIRRVYEQINRALHGAYLKHPPDAELFAERLEAALQYARIAHRKAALMHVEITGIGDNVAALDDSTGTALLPLVAERMMSTLRDTDTLACQGENGFAILLDSVRKLDDVATVAERIVHEICLPFITGQEKIYLAASVGICIFPDDAVDAPELCRLADAAMRLAREGGGSKYHFHIEERASIDAEVNKLIGHS